MPLQRIRRENQNKASFQGLCVLPILYYFIETQCAGRCMTIAACVLINLGPLGIMFRPAGRTGIATGSIGAATSGSYGVFLHQD